MPIEIAQQNLGHASLATTTVYVTTEKRRRMKAVEAFWRRWALGGVGQSSHALDLKSQSRRRGAARRANDLQGSRAEYVQERCMKRISGRVRFVEGLVRTWLASAPDRSTSSSPPRLPRRRSRPHQIPSAFVLSPVFPLHLACGSHRHASPGRAEASENMILGEGKPTDHRNIERRIAIHWLDDRQCRVGPRSGGG